MKQCPSCCAYEVHGLHSVNAQREAAAAIDAALAREASDALLSPCAWRKEADSVTPIEWFCSFCGDKYGSLPEHGFCANEITCRASIRARVARDAWRARERVVKRAALAAPESSPAAVPACDHPACTVDVHHPDCRAHSTPRGDETDGK